MNIQESEIVSKAFGELAQDMEIDSFSEDEQEQMLSKLTEVVTKGVFVEVMSKIGEEGRIEYEKKLSENCNSDEIMNFFSEKVPNFNDLVLSVIDKIRSEMSSEIV